MFKSETILQPNRTRSSLVLLFFSYLSIVLVVIQGVVLVPLYLQKFNITLYGAWLASGNIISYLSLFDFGFGIVMQQQVSELYGKHAFDRAGSLLGTGIVVMGGFSLIVILVGMGLAPFVPIWIGISGTDAIILKQSIYLATISTGLTIWAFSFLSGIIAFQQMLMAGLPNIISWVIGILVTYLSLMYSNIGLLAIPLGYLIRAIIFFTSTSCYFIWLMRIWKVEIKFSYQELSLFSSVIGLVAISNTAKRMSVQMDSLLAAVVLGPEQAAILNLSGRLLEAVRPIPDRISSSLLPGLSHLFGEGNLDRIRELFLDVMNITMSISTLCAAAYIALNKEFTYLWIGGGYFMGLNITIVIALSFVAIMFRSAAIDLLFSIREINSTSWLGLLEIMFRLIFSAFFAVRLGVIGIPLGAFVSTVAVNGIPVIWLFIRKAGIPRTQLMNEGKFFILQMFSSFTVAVIWGKMVGNQSPIGFVFSTISLLLILTCLLFAINLRIRTHVAQILKNI